MPDNGKQIPDNARPDNARPDNARPDHRMGKHPSDDKALFALDEFMSRRSNLDTFTARMADGTLIGKLVARLPEDVAAKAIDQVTEWINQELRKTAPEQEPEPALGSTPESLSEPILESAMAPVSGAQGAMEELTYDNCPESSEEAVCY